MRVDLSIEEARVLVAKQLGVTFEEVRIFEDTTPITKFGYKLPVPGTLWEDEIKGNLDLGWVKPLHSSNYIVIGYVGNKIAYKTNKPTDSKVYYLSYEAWTDEGSLIIDERTGQLCGHIRMVPAKT